jgi:hypothetical protein
VNALAAGQSITFNPKLTIVFGENAAGKTGYVRILKRASNARTKEPILPNLYREQQGTPTATIECIEGDQASTVMWHNEEGLSPINRVDVFDVRAAAIHVDEDLTYTYTPGELNRFPHLQHAIGTIKDRLEQAINERATTKNVHAASPTQHGALRDHRKSRRDHRPRSAPSPSDHHAGGGATDQRAANRDRGAQEQYAASTTPGRAITP